MIEMTRELIEQSRGRRGFDETALLVATITLLVSLAIAATTVSIGIARADVLKSVATEAESLIVYQDG